MTVKDRILHDVEKYGYAFLAFYLQEEPETIAEIAAFADGGSAFTCWAPNPEKYKYGIAVHYLSLEEAKDTLLQGKCSLFSTWNDLKHHMYLSPDPENEAFKEFLKSWFNDVENGQKGDK